jgi:histidinol-phosphatase (PHP family)
VADEAAYRADIAALKAEYAGRLDILCGMEQDRYAPVNPAHYDYIIGSCHYLPPAGGRCFPVDDTRRLLQEAVAQRYNDDALALARDDYAGVVAMVTQQRPTIVGHFDLIKKFNADGGLFNERGGRYCGIAMEAMDAVLHLLSEYGGMLEINTGAMARGLRADPYPAEFLLRQAAQNGAQVIITSDAHRAAGLDAGFDKALRLAANAGFRAIRLLKDGGFKTEKLG